MQTVEEAIGQLRAAARPVCGVESVPLDRAAGRVLARAVNASRDVPPADNSAMDGYAFRWDDWPGSSKPMPVSTRIAAGMAPGALAPGTAGRIFTGAEIPAGADTVVMQEHTRVDPGGVVIEKRPDRCANVRPRGQDISAGQQILPAGRRLRAQELGLLASVGLGQVKVYRRLKVAVLSNGDELVEPGAELAPGQIYNSNRYLLAGLFQGWGFEVVDRGITGDDPAALERQLREATESADAVVSTGGVSVGEEDHVKAVVQKLGALDLWKIAMKPGKPLAFGRVGDTPFIGLPGNPASALVTALVVARPFLFDCQGRADARVEPVPIIARFGKRGSPRQEYLRVRREADGLVPYPNQSSGVLLSACWGDGLAVQAPDRDIAEGDEVPYLSYASLG
jgi:molybdopterin molybdotransferase